MADYIKDITLKQSSRRGRNLIALVGLLGILFAMYRGNIVMACAIISIPLSFAFLIQIIRKPSYLLYFLFIMNYVMMGLMRYFPLAGISVAMDIVIVFEFIILGVHSALNNDVPWKNAANVLTWGLLAWMVYCLLEVVNGNSIFMAWLLSRSLIYYGLAIAVIAAVLIVNKRRLKAVVILYAILTMLAILKALMQKYVGFDAYERYWLESGGASTHILFSGIRYFSFFTDSGNFGSNMGCAAIFFGILFFYVKNIKYKISALVICGLAIYTMFMSGTRGAIAVPLVGLAYYTLAAKNFKILGLGGLLLIVVYSLLAFTTIGQSNDMVRRMRTAFRPTKDASYNIRLINQEKLAPYMKHRPFGEGLGLSGGTYREYGYSFTMTVPNDSWYVKLWVETGVVGLTLYLAILVIIVLKCTLIVMFKIKDKQLKGVLLAMLSGNVGLFVSAYGNPFLGQFPTLVLVNTFFAIVMVGPQIEKKYFEDKKEIIQ